MIEKILCIHKADIQQHYSQQSKEQRKKKEKKRFEDILVMLSHSPVKPAGYWG